MSERFEKTKSDVADFRIYDYKNENAYFINSDEHTIDCLVDLLNELSDENDGHREEIINSHIAYVKCLNEIKDLKEENEQLRQMIKGNVFHQYREGSLADLEFKSIAYDDIIEVKLSDELEPKVIVSCRQGKKENVKSFCQMFIPFGIAYEIKEIIE